MPLPFPIPFLSEIFGGNVGTLLVFFIVFCVMIFEFMALIYLIYEYFVSRKIDKSLILEVVIYPIIIFSLAQMNFNLIDSQIDFIFWINKNRQIENFHNPFLGFQMRDCRKFTDSFDVVFIPRHISIETDYLTYAPKREANNDVYRYGKELNDDWYIANSGSMWSDNLRKCYLQNNNPF